jgi:TolB-like protein/predicted Ser/Thr protein kinase
MMGESISHYRILEKIGEGGMGIIYKAEDTRLNRPVALKFLPPHLLTSDNDRRRFVNEAQAAARLSHTGICTVYEIDTAGEHTFIAMEYIPGEDLARKISSGPLEFNRAAEIALDLCGALREAHAAGVTHRDIKPSNVMISDKGRTVLLDFGVARLKTDSKLTRTGTTIGTSAYMSPEQARGESIDHRADIWSLGVVLYEMLTGQLPFKADHEAATLYAIVNEEPEPIRNIRPNVPAPLQKIVEKALEKRLSERYQNADALEADLEVLLGKQEGKATPSAVRLGVEEARRWRFIRVGWVALFVIIAAMGVWLWPRGNPGSEGPTTNGRPTGAEHAPASPQKTGERNSIAVLPLADMSAGSGSEFFADGMTEEILTQLAGIEALKVISRTSVMQYKNTTKRLTDIAGELGVADVLALQRQVARDVASEIRIELTPEETKRLAASTVVNKKAHDLYLQGRYHWNQRTPDGLRRAMEYYQQALAVDPGYALAYAGIAETYSVAVSWGYLPARDAGAKAREMATKALSIDPDLPSANAVLGLVAQICDWDWDAAERYMERAIELNPGDATAHQWYAKLLASTGRYGEAATEARISSDRDPLSAGVNGAAGYVLALNGEFAAARGLLEKAEGLDPASAPLHFYEYIAYNLMGEKDKAVHAIIRHFKLVAESDREHEEVAALREAMNAGGTDAYYSKALDILEQRDRDGLAHAAHYVANCFARLGQMDSAMVWLERSYLRREVSLSAILAGDGSFRPLESDPRFIDLIGRMGLPAPPSL